MTSSSSGLRPSVNPPSLPENPTLADFQRYVREIEIHRNFAAQGVVEKCLLLGEEVGELFKAVRRQINLGVDQTSKIGSVQEELADVFIFLCAIANRFDVDLETAFVEKERVNSQRQWT